MKYIDEFRNNKLAKKLSRAIFDKASSLGRINLMEVCGTHTMSICKFGIREIIPKNINLISGPGCPVCVTPKTYIDKGVAFSRIPGVIVTTFGDMMRVPGSLSSLIGERASGKDVRVVYSPLDAVDIAEDNPQKNVIFLGVGFETTTPTVAASLVHAKKTGVKNFFVFSGHKVVMPAVKALLDSGDININGFICPAHVSAIIGLKPYEVAAKKYGASCVVTGFEPLDILQGILMLVDQIIEKNPKVENQYKRVVKRHGNPKALAIIDTVFTPVDTEWRGIGMIPKSGLLLDKKYSVLDAEKEFSLPEIKTKPDVGCICGSVLKGIKTPLDCKLFGKKCIPENPVGACMVSSEGTCAAYYKYRK